MKTKYLRKIAFGLLATLVVACSEELERADYVAFESKTMELVTPATGSGDVELKVFATTKSGSTRTFTIEVDPSTTAAEGTYTVPSTVTIPANSTVGTFTVMSDAINIGKKIVLKFASVESTYLGTPMTINVFEECLENLLFLDIRFDNYPDEFGWEIVDGSDNVVAGKDFGAYSTAFRVAQIRERICLVAGTYTFTVYDFYGDGMADGTNIGNFALRKVSDGTTLASGSGNFGFSTTKMITVP